METAEKMLDEWIEGLDEQYVFYSLVWEFEYDESTTVQFTLN